jgi:hypothetical protein
MIVSPLSLVAQSHNPVIHFCDARHGMVFSLGFSYARPPLAAALIMSFVAGETSLPRKAYMRSKRQ